MLVEEAYYEQTPHTTDAVFLTLMQVMEEVMKAKGKNTYRLPHMAKEKLRRAGTLPKTLLCSEEAIEAALEKMSEGFN